MITNEQILNPTWAKLKESVEGSSFTLPVWWTKTSEVGEDNEYDIVYKCPYYYAVVHVYEASDVAEFEAWSKKSNDYECASTDDCKIMAQTYGSPKVSQDLSPIVESAPVVGTPGHKAVILVSHHFGEPTTWWQTSTRMGGSWAGDAFNSDWTDDPYVLTADTGEDPDYKVWQASIGDRVWINIRDSRVTMGEFNTKHPAVDWNGNLRTTPLPPEEYAWDPVSVWMPWGEMVAQSLFYVRFFKRTIAGPGEWTELSESTDLEKIDYTNGKLYLNAGVIATDGTEELGAVFCKCTDTLDNTFIVRPSAGHVWKLTRSEINRSAGHDFNLNGAFPIFEYWVDPYFLKTEIWRFAQKDYGTMFRLQDSAVGAHTLIAAGGGEALTTPCARNGYGIDQRQGMLKAAEIMKWPFEEAPYVLRQDKGTYLRLYTDNSLGTLIQSEYCSYTFYFGEDNI